MNRHERLDAGVPQPWQPRFSVGTLLRVMLVFSVMAAAGSYLIRAQQGGRPYQLVFLLFTVASPLLLLALVAGVRAAAAWLARRRDRTR